MWKAKIYLLGMLVIIFNLMFPRVSFSGSAFTTWEQVPLRSENQKAAGLYGGEGFQQIMCIAYAPSNPDIVYLCADTIQLWKSTDGGSSWKMINKGFNANGGFTVTVDPYNPDIVFVAGSHGDEYSSNLENSVSGIFRSTDGGENWARVKDVKIYGKTNIGEVTGVDDQKHIGRIIVFDSTSYDAQENKTKVIYAGTWKNGLYKSIDGGGTWARLDGDGITNVNTFEVYDVKIKPGNSSFVYIATNDGLYRYNNSDSTFTKIGLNLLSYPRTIAIHPNNTDTMYVACGYKGIYYSTDGGNTFVSRNTGLSTSTGKKEYVYIAMSPANPSVLYASPGNDGKNPFWSHDGGATWSVPTTIDEDNLCFDSSRWFPGFIEPHPSRELIALTTKNGGATIIKTENGGSTWKFSGNGYCGGRRSGKTALLFFNDPNSNRMIFPLVDFGFAETLNGGDTFRLMEMPKYANGEQFSFGMGTSSTPTGDCSPDGQTLIAGVGAWGQGDGKQVLISSFDGGMTWTPDPYTETIKATADYYKFIKFHPQNPEVVYAQTFRSLDGGHTWEGPLTRSIRAVYQSAGDTVYSYSNNVAGPRIFKSTNKGTSWTTLLPYLPITDDDGITVTITDIEVSPNNPDLIYAVTENGLYIYKNNNWEYKGVSAGITKYGTDPNYIRWIAIDQNHPEVVYIGKYNGDGRSNGIFRSTDSGEHWTNITYNIGPEANIWAISISPHDGTVYVCSHGTWKLPAPYTDTIPPVVSPVNPSSNEGNVLRNTDIIAEISDSGTGVNASSVVMKINGEIVVPVITEDAGIINVSYDPGQNFVYDQMVNVEISVQDLTYLPNQTTCTYSFTILPDPNHVPVINSFEPLSLTPSVNEGESLSFSVNASDVDGDDLIYQWKLDNVEVSTSAGYVYSPGNSGSGTYSVTLNVSDGYLSANKSWSITVNNTLPVTYYVDATGGNDNNSGLSETSAWKTTNKVSNRMSSFQPGDTISFKRGEVWYKSDDILANRYYITINKSGTVGYPITFNSYGSGPLPVVGGIYINKANYINIDGIQSDVVITGTEAGTGYTKVNRSLYLVGSHDINITNSVFDGKDIMNKKGGGVVSLWKEPSSGDTITPSYNIVFRNCEILNAGSDGRNPDWGNGLQINEGVYDIVIEGCKIHDNYGNNIEASGGVDSYKYDWGCNVILRDNEIYNSPDKIGNTYYKDGINIGWNFKDCIVERNYIHDVNLPVQTDSRTSNNIIRNNILVNGTTAFIRVLATSVSSPSSPEYPFNGQNEKTFILNNTFISNIVNPNGFTIGIWFSTDGEVGGTGHIVKNNLFYSSFANFEYICNFSDPESMIEFTSNNNLFYTTTGSGRFRYKNVFYDLDTWKATGRDTESIFSDPLISFSNYLPPSNSPVIDKGADLSAYVSDDYQGVSRPYDEGYDIGAYEINYNQLPQAMNKNLEVDEDFNLSIALEAFDPDGDSLIYSIVSQPVHGVLSGTASDLIYTPVGNYNGEDSFTFKVNDGTIDSNIAAVSIIIRSVNDTPVLDFIPDVTVNEGAVVNINPDAADIDGDDLNYVYSGWMTSSSYTTNDNDSGIHTVTVTVSDGKGGTASQDVKITVNNVNRNPVFTGIVNKDVNEGANLNFTVTANDSDGDDLIYSAASLPVGAAFEGQTFNWTPDYTQTGNYEVTFSVSDNNGGSDSETITISVGNVNRPPHANDNVVSTNEDESKNIVLTGSDSDNNNLTFSIVTNPSHGTLSGTIPNLIYTPVEDYNGSDSFTFKVNDGAIDSDIATVFITVNSVNDAPVLDFIPDITVNEGGTVNIIPHATDVDGDNLNYICSGWMTSSSYTTNYNDAGIHTVTVTVQDGNGGTDSQDITVTVNNTNRSPVLETIGNKEVNEGANLNFTVTANDSDGDDLIYSAASLPVGAAFEGQTFNWTPDYTQTGNYEVTFSVSDGNGGSDSESITISVGNVNRPPHANDNAVSTNEDESKNIVLVGSDPDVNDLEYYIVTNPSHGTLSPDLVYIPVPNYNGSDSFTFKVNDGSLDSDIANVSIVVNSVNDVPVLDFISDIMVNEGGTVNINPHVTDVDGDNLIYTYSGWMASANYTTNYNDSGVHTVTVTVSDGKGGTASQDVKITVNNVNRPPHANENAVSTNEDESRNFVLTGFDSDGNNLEYSIVTNPSHGVLSGTAPHLIYYPVLNYNGSDSFSFRVYDGEFYSTAQVMITINPVNDAPVLNPIGNKLIKVSQQIYFTISAFDIDYDSLTYSVTNMPQGAVFNEVTKSFPWMPKYNQAGNYQIHFEVSDGVAKDFEDIVITVENPPQYDPTLADCDIDNTNGLRRIDGHDLFILSRAFGSSYGESNWNLTVDINKDGIVDGNDLIVLANNFGRKY